MDDIGRQTIDSIVTRIKDGNPNGIKHLYDIVSNPTRHIALKYLHNVDDADDLIQDFWGDIFSVIENYHYNKNFYGYLCKVIKNLAIDRFKRMHKNSSVKAEFVKYGEMYFCDDSFTEKYDKMIMVEQALSRLLPIQRIVIQTVYFERKTIREIADDLNMSKSEVYRQKQIALRRLKAFLDE